MSSDYCDDVQLAKTITMHSSSLYIQYKLELYESWLSITYGLRCQVEIIAVKNTRPVQIFYLWAITIQFAQAKGSLLNFSWNRYKILQWIKEGSYPAVTDSHYILWHRHVALRLHGKIPNILGKIVCRWFIRTLKSLDQMVDIDQTPNLLHAVPEVYRAGPNLSHQKNDLG